jgi:hypothetical protein
LNVERAAPERRAPGAQLEVLEQAIDFPSQALERPPLGGTIGLLFRGGGQLGCNFNHGSLLRVGVTVLYPNKRAGTSPGCMKSAAGSVRADGGQNMFD